MSEVQAELRAEVDHHDRVRAAMGAMRRTTIDLVAGFRSDFIEGKANRFAHDGGPDHNLGSAMARYRDDRLENLADRDIPLFFGRLWLDTGQDYHLGRRHVRDESDRATPLVIDWRAPVAERYYRASMHQRLEVCRRRRFGFQGSVLTGFEDEDLRLGEDFSSELLTAEIERPRTGPMRDIVATIQPEQDELIRRELATTLCVQGAPGTGKTAVGLHRAAWLLYSYPNKLGRSGMLVVGPNDGFLRYIGGVLPTLGESAVWQVTVEELTGAVDARFDEPVDVTRLKHDARMAQVCERAVWSHVGAVEEEVIIAHAGGRWVLDGDYLADAVNRAIAGSRTWTIGRKAVEQAVVRGVVRQFEVRHLRSPESRWVTELKRQPAFKALLDAVWPRLTARQVLRRLYVDEKFRASVCSGLLTDEETALLRRGKGALKLAAADLLLLDEIQGHLRPIASEKTYGHVVVDEAQDLSPMQCRAVARRCPSGSLTVLGDLAQGTTPWAADRWETQMEHLGREDVEYTELTAGYRVPGVIIDLANRILPHLGVAVSPARSVRSDGSVDVVRSDDLAGATVEAVKRALDDEGLVGVIAAEETLEAVRQALPASDRVEVVPAALAKGLEFDHVVVAEPAEVVAAPATGGEPRDGVGLRHLYVALTRAVSRLTIVHTRPIPPELGQLPSRARAVA
ncbi:AAA family ATPase [Georgenia daeguensis]|uniref:HelD family protein n=1 Tax=Georgenia daeguensis TaxID=908355 RepID=UPI0031E86939